MFLVEADQIIPPTLGANHIKTVSLERTKLVLENAKLALNFLTVLYFNLDRNFQLSKLR